MIELLFTSWPVALSLWCVLQLLDIWSTKIALARGARELNPIIAWCMKNLGQHGWIVFKLVVAGICAGLLLHLDAIWMLWVLNALFVGVVYWNFRVLKKRLKSPNSNNLSA